MRSQSMLCENMEIATISGVLATMLCESVVRVWTGDRRRFVITHRR
jgi:hypothetical protein